jgi:Ribbon-helix-helix domain
MAPRRSQEPITRISVFLYDRQIAALNEVNARTQVPISVLIRQGIDLVLERHGAKPAKPRKRSAGS